jgi:hypothetical protein
MMGYAQTFYGEYFSGAEAQQIFAMARGSIQKALTLMRIWRLRTVRMPYSLRSSISTGPAQKPNSSGQCSWRLTIWTSWHRWRKCTRRSVIRKRPSNRSAGH